MLVGELGQSATSERDLVLHDLIQHSVQALLILVLLEWHDLKDARLNTSGAHEQSTCRGHDGDETNPHVGKIGSILFRADSNLHT